MGNTQKVYGDFSEIKSVSKYLKLIITSADLVSLTSGNPGQVNFIGSTNVLPVGSIVKSMSLRVITLFTGGRTGVLNFVAGADGIDIISPTEISSFSGALPLSTHVVANQIGNPANAVSIGYQFTSPGGIDTLDSLTNGELELLVEYFDPVAMPVNGVVAQGF